MATKPPMFSSTCAAATPTVASSRSIVTDVEVPVGPSKTFPPSNADQSTKAFDPGIGVPVLGGPSSTGRPG